MIGKEQPLVSIVIANYNYGRFLGDAIESVLMQSCKDFELIVVDGGSTDNSVDVIKKYEKDLGWWVSERDQGQSDAFNKGFSHASGRFLTWLNADDILLPGTIAALKGAVRRHPACQWFTGNYLQFFSDSRRIRFAPWGPHMLPRCVQTKDSPLVIFGPTTFWSREAYDCIGPLDVTLHYSMDTDYWLRLRTHGVLQRRLNHCCWAFRMHDQSKTAIYENRQIDANVEAKWYEELRRVNDKNDYHSSVFRTRLARVLRVLDGSFFVMLYRSVFLVGRKFDNIYQKIN